jgi:integrase
VDRELAILRAAVRAVWKAGKLTRLPGFPRVNSRPGRDIALSEAEADRLLAAADAAAPHLRLYVYTALFTAGRNGAILELGWDQIDLGLRPRIRLNPAGRRQTAKGRATVPMPDRLAAVLRQARTVAEQDGTLGLPLIHWRGRPVRSVRKGFRRVVEAAGLAVTGPARVTPHVLRHTAATFMAMRGVPLPQIAAFLGQTIQKTTEKYIHVTPDHLEQARAALDRESLRPRAVGGTLALALVVENEKGTP